MKIVCAWCQKEGRNAVLGEREPLDDKTETHGICTRHSQTLVEQLPSASFPGIRALLVVHYADSALYDYLVRSFSAVSGVAVMLDRRRRDRRAMPGQVAVERRRGNRRIRKSEFSSLGYYMVRFGAEREPVAEPIRKFPALVRRLAK